MLNTRSQQAMRIPSHPRAARALTHAHTQAHMRARAHTHTTPRPWLLPFGLLLVLLSLPQAEAGNRPNLSNARLSSPFGSNGHTSSLDGRLFIGNVGEDHTNNLTTWRARIFKPEALSYTSEGVPVFTNTFSAGKDIVVGNGENALAFCFSDPTRPFTLSNGKAVYTPWIFDSQMYGNGTRPNDFRRRTLRVEVSNPFTTSAEVSSFTLGTLEFLTDTSGKSLKGIEPTMTSDGRLFIFQGSPANNGEIDRIMYSYNPSPCATSGWSVPRPLSQLYSDTNAELKNRYALARAPLKAADGQSFDTSGSTNLVRGAYPWVDHEGRNVLYMGAVYTDGARREAATLIGADTSYFAYHIDGAINSERLDMAQLFYSSPMWNFEQERAPEQNFPSGSSNEDHYLPVTKTHDVLALFGSNTADYSEVDIGQLLNPYHLLWLPMNELITRAGEYDLKRTPDLSGRFYTGTLVGGASISATSATRSGTGSFWAPQGRGRAVQLSGLGQAVKLTFPRTLNVKGVTTAVKGFTLQLSLKPDANINSGCSGNPYRYVLSKANKLDLIYEADGSVQLSLYIGSTRVRLGTSPILPKGSWSQLAYTFDGTTGTFVEYLNGVSTGRSLPTVAAGSTFSLGAGDLYVGSSSALNAQSCPSTGEGSFVGLIDEVRLFSHTRSNRSVCLETLGASCADQAIQVDPSAGQFALSNQQPTCSSKSALDSAACLSAQHRTCAQLGTVNALDSASNLADTVLQLIGNRPPVALAGVPTAATTSTVSLACMPIEHESLATTYEELSRRFHEGCVGDGVAASVPCAAAAHRFCVEKGWTSGQIFEVTSRPWVSCFDADLVSTVAQSALSGCSSSWTSGDCRIAVSGFCQTKGYGGGLIQEQPSSTTAEIHCFEPSTTATWKWNP